METKNKDLDNLISEVKDYLETRSKLGKLKVVDQGSQLAGSLAVVLVLILIAFIFIIFISIAGAYLISAAFEKDYAGFIAISVFYFILGILIYVKRESWIKTPLINNIISTILKGSEDENQ